MKRMMLVVVALISAACSARAYDGTAVVGEVLDAGTIRVEYNGNQEALRLIGLDAPEGQASESEDKKEELARRKAVDYINTLVYYGYKLSLEFDIEQRDREQRLLAYAYLEDGTMLNYAVLYAGYASAKASPPNVKYSGLFRRACDSAMVRRRGLWKQ